MWMSSWQTYQIYSILTLLELELFINLCAIQPIYGSITYDQKIEKLTQWQKKLFLFRKFDILRRNSNVEPDFMNFVSKTQISVLVPNFFLVQYKRFMDIYVYPKNWKRHHNGKNCKKKYIKKPNGVMVLTYSFQSGV